MTDSEASLGCSLRKSVKIWSNSEKVSQSQSKSVKISQNQSESVKSDRILRKSVKMTLILAEVWGVCAISCSDFKLIYDWFRGIWGTFSQMGGFAIYWRFGVSVTFRWRFGVSQLDMYDALREQLAEWMIGEWQNGFSSIRFIYSHFEHIWLLFCLILASC